MEGTMKTITRFSLGLALALAASAAVGTSFAQDQPRERPDRPFMRRGGPDAFRGPGGPFMLPLRRLGLTDVQRDQVRAIFESHREETRALGERASTARQALHAAVTADNFEEGTIRARSSELGAVETELAIARARVHGEIVGILTASQKAELKKLEEERAKRQ
jgi:Spy/CpxP family protein refolding chaperone